MHMDMTVVLGIFTLFFFVTLSLMSFYRSKINVKICNIMLLWKLCARKSWAKRKVKMR